VAVKTAIAILNDWKKYLSTFLSTSCQDYRQIGIYGVINEETACLSKPLYSFEKTGRGEKI
jgi:hypothetical protein